MGLSLEDFKEVFRVVLGIDNVDKQIERLFMKIDTSSDGYIDWDEFCSYMQLEYAEKEAVNRRAMEVQFDLPVSYSEFPERSVIIPDLFLSERPFGLKIYIKILNQILVFYIYNFYLKITCDWCITPLSGNCPFMTDYECDNVIFVCFLSLG